MKTIFTVLFIVVLSCAFAQKVDLSIFENMNMRQIGPAGMSGRVTCIDVVQEQPNTMYIGAASGGVWRSTSGGTEWEPIGDTMPTLNIGALAIQQSNPSVIWVGTGEGNPRNSQSSGFGLFRTLDGGRTWELMGLENTRNIHRIIIHPQDPNTLWVGAQGPAWGDNVNRGVYKTTDGGKTWRHVLKGNKRTGIGDLVIDPNNSNKLIANLWEFRRNPWFFNSGGEFSGLYISHDGGETWEERTDEDGLPKGDMGRIGLAIAPSNSNRVYAKIEAKSNDLYRSDDGGFNWKKISSDENSGNRPFYYSDIFVDPINENRVYSLWTRLSVSEDGGKSWQKIIPYWSVHPDNHAFWVHPKDPNYIILGNDGGLAISRDGASSWRFVQNLPIAQYYHINIDNELPYNIYGGMQDNGSWRGPAYVWASGGIRNAYFRELMFGDGFDVSPDPDFPNRYGYAMSQGGNLGRYDLETGYTKNISPTLSDTTKLRFNWNAPLAQDPFDSKTIYYGSQFVHVSRDNGDSWELISPDLTTNDTSKQKQLMSGGLTLDVTGAENYTTLTAIEPSRVEPGLIWVGSDDGRLSISKDGGGSWSSLENKLPDMPKGAWIPQIHASSLNKDEAFVVVNDYRRNNWDPFLYHTKNAGKSWKRLAFPKDISGYCLSVVQDPVVPDLVFLGSENGLYVSFDRGLNWNHWKNGYPNVSTMDLKIQEREKDLVIGTFGRAAYILDDISPLRELAKESLDAWKEKRLIVFDIPTAYHVKRKRAPGHRFGADDTWQGQNRSSAARIQVYFENEQSDPDLKKTKGTMRVYNSSGDTIRTLNVELENGVSLIHWSLDSKRMRMPNQKKPKKEDAEIGGRPVLPGTYTVELECDSVRSAQKIVVLSDPRMAIPLAELNVQQTRFDKVDGLIHKVTALCDELRSAQNSIKKVNELLPLERDSTQIAIHDLGKKVNDSIQSILEGILGRKDVKGIFRDDATLLNKLNKPLWITWGTVSGNEQSFNNAYVLAEKAVEKTTTEVRSYLIKDWNEYKNQVSKIILDPFEE